MNSSLSCAFVISLLSEMTRTQCGTSSRVLMYWQISCSKDISDVIQLQVQGVTDIIYRIADLLKSSCGPKENDLGQLVYKKMKGDTCDQFIEMFGEVERLTDYSNGILKEHAQTYGCKTWKLAYDPNSWRVLK